MTSNRSIRLSIKANLSSVSIVGAIFRTLSAEFGLSVVACAEIELAVVEATTNIVKYGLAHCPEEEIHFSVSNEGYILEILIEDKGIPMPEEALVNADGSVFDYDAEDMDSWPMSGMGLSLIKAVMNTVEYHADAHGNILRMVKNTLSS